jgi:outer membrane protein assembly factor BamB
MYNMKRGVLLLMVLSVALVANGDTVFQQRWENLVQRGGANKRNEAQSVALRHNRTVVGAILGRTESFDTDIVVRGFNTTTGNLVWSDEFPGTQVFVEAAQDYAIAVGVVGDSQLGIRSYDLHSGAIRWTTNAMMFAPQAVLIRGGKLVIVGQDVEGLILVFDAGTGTPLWSRSVDILPILDPVTGIGNSSRLWDVDQGGLTLVVAGSVQTGTGVSPITFSTVIRSYRLADGFLRWEVRESSPTFPTHVRIGNHMAYVAGGAGGGFLAAYRLADGHQEWQTASPPPSVISLAVNSMGVVAGGFQFVGAFDPFTGTPLWSKTPNREIIIRVLPVGSQTIVVAVDFGPEPQDDQQLVVRLLDANGDVLAADVRDSGFRNSYEDAAFLNGRLAVVGRLTGIAGGALTRVYELQTGIQPE